MTSPPTRGSRLKVIAYNGCTFSYLHFPFCPCCDQILLSSSSPKHLYRDFLLSIPTTTIQVTATVSVEFNRKINFTPDSLNKAFNEKAMLGVWSGLRKQMSERGTQGTGVLDAITTPSQGSLRGHCAPKAQWEPQRKLLWLKGGSGRELWWCSINGEGGSFSPPLLPPSTGTACWPNPVESRVEGTPKMQTSWSALSTKQGRVQIWRLKWRVRKTAGSTTKASPKLPTLLFSIMWQECSF